MGTRAAAAETAEVTENRRSSDFDDGLDISIALATDGASSKSAAMGTSSAAAIFATFSTDRFRSPRSTPLM